MNKKLFKNRYIMNKKSVKGTVTEQNLLKAFMGESGAYNRYMFFAKVASKEGYEKIAAIFEETALNEQEHAKLFFKHLEGGFVEITASYPAGVISDTLTNLSQAACGEYEEWSLLYPKFGYIAKEEGFPKIATLFELISSVEQHHEKRYKAYHKLLQGHEIFSSDKKQIWRCRKCGFEHEGSDAPEKCPLCSHPQAYFEAKNR